MNWIYCSSAVVLGLGGLFAWQIRRRHMHRWLSAYLREASRRRPPAPGQDVHLLLLIADHFEPKCQGADRAHGLRRVGAWVDGFPRQFGRFRDSDGRPPRYTFFFPIEEYEPEYLDRQSNAAKSRSALLEKFRANQESYEDFAKRQSVLLEIRVAREAREAERKAVAEAARQVELEQLAKLKAEEEERARQLAAEQKARRDERYASRKKRKKGLRYARPTGAPTSAEAQD